MGRLDAIIDNSLEQRFRMEITRRYGGRKGDLTRGLEEAMELWIRSDVIENLKQKALMQNGLPQARKDTIDTLKAQGKASMPALSELLIRGKLLPSEEAQINAILRELAQLR